MESIENKKLKAKKNEEKKGSVFHFLWYRPERPEYGYEWRTDLEPVPSIKRKEEIFLVPKGESQVYNPLEKEIEKVEKIEEETKPLFIKFAELDGSKERILKFANTYGWLGIPIPLIKKGAKSSEVFLGESLSDWRKEIEDIKLLLPLWEGIKEYEERAVKLSKLIFWQNKGVFYEYKEKQSEKTILIAGDKVNPNYYKEWKSGEVLRPAKFLLLQEVNKKLNPEKQTKVEKSESIVSYSTHIAISPQILLTPKEDDYILKYYLKPRNLLSAIWLLFLFAITGQSKIVRCRVCGEWMDNTEHPKRKMHYACGNREKFRRYYEKKKALKKKELGQSGEQF